VSIKKPTERNSAENENLQRLQLSLEWSIFDPQRNDRGGKMDRIRHIIFDLGNVLVEIHPERTMKNFAQRCGHSLQTVQSFFLSRLHLDFMAGKYTPQAFYQTMIQQYPCQISLEEFVRIWKQVIGEPKPGIEELVRELATDYELSICSNTDPWHWEVVTRNYRFVQYFKRFFLSYQIGFNKPHPRVFETILQELRCSGEEIVFIDDSEENIKAAEKFGIHGIVASSTAEIREGLVPLIPIRTNS
jgi:putative hydrolase of the HAD superfamily